MKVVNAIDPMNQSLIVDVGETNNLGLIITHDGVEVLECLCGDDISQIECYPPKSNNDWLTLQKNTKHYGKAKIISKQTNHGTPTPCYVGQWSTAKGVSIELHKSRVGCPHNDANFPQLFIHMVHIIS